MKRRIKKQEDVKKIMRKRGKGEKDKGNKKFYMK